MSPARLVWANLRRTRVRSVLTVASFAVAVLLFGLLLAISSAMGGGAEVGGADRLVVINKAAITRMLPLSHGGRLARVPGVGAVIHATWFGGVYQDGRSSFPQYAIDATSLRSVYPEYRIPEVEWEAFLADRQGACVGQTTARRFGWKVGDRIPIKGSYLQGVFELNIRAIYTSDEAGVDTTVFWFHYGYLETHYGGLVGWYVARIAPQAGAASVIKVIDESFANSAWETKSQTEKAFGAYFTKQLGDIKLLVLAIGMVVLVTLLLVSGNTMAIAVRERTRELAVLKAVGFGRGLVLGLVLAESEVLAVSGGVVGAIAARAVIGRVSGMFPGMVLDLPSAGLATGIAFALVVGFLGGGLPALAAMRLRVVDGLRRV